MGNETTLLDCSYNISAQCTSNQQAGVLCPGTKESIHTASFKIFTLSAAARILQGPVDIRVNALANAKFTCSAIAYPAPRHKWYRQIANGSLQALTDTTKYSLSSFSLGIMKRTSQLIILNVTLLAEGTYVCQATNDLTGSATISSATLTVLSEFDVLVYFTFHIIINY